LEDLRHSQRKCRLLILHGAEALFPSLDVDTIRIWRDWAESRSAVVMLMFRDYDGSRAAASLGAFAHFFAGMAQLKSRYGSTSLDIFHWFNDGGMIAGKTYPLYRDGKGALRAYEIEDKTTPTLAAAADEAQIMAMKSVFQQKEKTPRDWRVVDGDLDVLHALASGAVAATVILPFHVNSDFDR